MKLGTIPTVYLVAGAAVAGALLYVAMKGARSTGEAIGSGAVNLVDGVLHGAVVGIGEAVGIPPTNPTKCEQAMAEGRTWDASFDCDAATFLRYLWDRRP